MAFISRELLPGVFHIEDALGVCFTLLTGKRRALLVDTGYGLEDVRAFVRTLTDLPLEVWLTHGHHDHALGARWFPAVYLHPAEMEIYARYTGEAWRRHVLASVRAAGMEVDEAVYLAAPVPEPIARREETLDLGGMTARILPCPGHTPGSLVVYVPERGLLLSGDDWNECTWLFFPEALPAPAYRENLRGLLALPFQQVVCPHRTGLYSRATLDAFINGLTDAALAAAPAVDTGRAMGVDTRELALPEGQTLVFDAGKLPPSASESRSMLPKG